MSFITKKPALVAASCLALAGGGTGAAILATTADAATPGGASGTGTATVTVTGPSGTAHTSTPAASCRVHNGKYVLLLHSARTKHAKKANGTTGAAGTSTTSSGTATDRARDHAGRRSEKLTVDHYTGAGSYQGRLQIARHRGHSFSGHSIKVSVQLTATGGSYSYTKTLSGKHKASLKGKTVSNTASWTCAA